MRYVFAITLLIFTQGFSMQAQAFEVPSIWTAHQICKNPPDKFTCAMLEPSIASSGFSSVRRMWAKLYRLALDGRPTTKKEAENLMGEWLGVLNVQREPNGIISPRWFPNAGKLLETALVNKLGSCTSDCDKLLPNNLMNRTLQLLENDKSSGQDLPRQIRRLMKQHGREESI